MISKKSCHIDGWKCLLFKRNSFFFSLLFGRQAEDEMLPVNMSYLLASQYFDLGKSFSLAVPFRLSVKSEIKASHTYARNSCLIFSKKM